MPGAADSTGVSTSKVAEDAVFVPKNAEMVADFSKRLLNTRSLAEKTHAAGDATKNEGTDAAGIAAALAAATSEIRIGATEEKAYVAAGAAKVAETDATGVAVAAGAIETHHGLPAENAKAAAGAAKLAGSDSANVACNWAGMGSMD